MKIILIVFSTLICTQAYSTNLSERTECLFKTRMFESRIRELVENLRDQLKDGIPEQNIPALDPFIMNDLIINFEDISIVSDLNITLNGKLSGLMSWDLTDVSFSLAGFKFSFEIRFTEIVGKTTYNLKGALSKLTPIYGDGELDVLAKDLIINASGKIGSQGSGDEQRTFLENLEIAISLDSFILNITGLLDNDLLSSYVSQLASLLLPGFIENYQKEITKIISSEITTLIDSLLVDVTIQDILDLLRPKPYMDKITKIHCRNY